MDIAFTSKDFRDQCLNEERARSAFGIPLAAKLKSRLADLAAVEFASELFALPGRPRDLDPHRRGHISMELVDKQLLIFKSGHIADRLLPSGATDWSKVRRVLVVGLEADDE